MSLVTPFSFEISWHQWCLWHLIFSCSYSCLYTYLNLTTRLVLLFIILSSFVCLLHCYSGFLIQIFTLVILSTSWYILSFSQTFPSNYFIIFTTLFSLNLIALCPFCCLNVHPFYSLSALYMYIGVFLCSPSVHFKNFSCSFSLSIYLFDSVFTVCHIVFIALVLFITTSLIKRPCSTYYCYSRHSFPEIFTP